MATQAKQVEAPKAPDTMRIWNAVSKTDPAHTKGFKRGGGFSGTAIKPMWVWQRLTDLFGPCGTGWGMDKPEYQVVNGDNREVLVFCTVAGWYVDNGERKVVFGEGGDKVVTYIKANDQYKRPERWENDDEAFKKAFTDALMNAFKFIGVGADVHMGMFEDSKYLASVREEFRAANDGGQGQGQDGAVSPDQPAKRQKLDGPYTTPTALKTAYHEFDRSIRSCGTMQDLDDLLAEPDNIALMEQMKRDARGYVFGSDKLPPEHEPLMALISRMQTELNAPTFINAG